MYTKAIWLLLWYALMAGNSFGGESFPAASPQEKTVSIQEKLERVRADIRADQGTQGLSSGSRIPKGQPGESSSSGTTVLGTAVKMVCGLVFIIFLSIACIRLLKKFQKASILKNTGRSSGFLEVLETCYLGNDQKVVVVRMKKGTAVLGVTTQGISLLKELEEDAYPRSEKPAGNMPHTEFSDNLNQFLARFKKPKTVSETLKEV